MAIPATCCGRDPARRSRFARPLLLAAFGAFLVLGCSGQSDVGPQFRITDQTSIDTQIERGKRFRGKNAYALYAKSSQRPVMRISPGVIISSVSMGRPQDEVAFTVANLPITADDYAIRKAVDEALPRINSRIKFNVVLQVNQGTDPKAIKFELMTSGGNTYPPVAVPEPRLLQELTGSAEGDVLASGIYQYEAYFQTTGSPGYPPLGVDVSSLDLTVKDGGAAGRVHFRVDNTTGG